VPNALWRISFQTQMTQNFSFFVFGGQHVYAVLQFGVGDWRFAFSSRADVSGRLSNRINFYKIGRTKRLTESYRQSTSSVHGGGSLEKPLICQTLIVLSPALSVQVR
jgi:hypothetical protein